MAPLLGGDLTQRVFLNRFAQLASDGLFHVRKILASNFGEFCAVVGQEITETVLVSWNLSFCSPPPTTGVHDRLDTITRTGAHGSSVKMDGWKLNLCFRLGDGSRRSAGDFSFDLSEMNPPSSERSDDGIAPHFLCFQLEKFYTLCQDELWGVRKACAEVFMSISRVVSQSKRRHDLGALFVNLLQDESRWVRMAAFQALGPFISTFADPAITALLHNENGEIVITDTEQLVSRMIKIEEERASAEEESSEENSTEELVQNQTDSSQTHQKSLETEENNKNNNTVNMDTEEDSWEAQLVSGVSESTSPEEMRAEKFLSSSDDSYSSFLYWREPVESLQLTDEDLAMSNIDNDNLDNLPDELLKLELSSTQNETKEETDFATDVLTNKTDDDKTESCDRVGGVEGKNDSVGRIFLTL